VPSAQICLPNQTIRLRQFLCSAQGEDLSEEGENGNIKKNQYMNGCPPKDSSEMVYLDFNFIV
jgi:hypothetical protein